LLFLLFLDGPLWSNKRIRNAFFSRICWKTNFTIFELYSIASADPLDLSLQLTTLLLLCFYYYYINYKTCLSFFFGHALRKQGRPNYSCQLPLRSSPTSRYKAYWFLGKWALNYIKYLSKSAFGCCYLFTHYCTTLYFNLHVHNICTCSCTIDVLKKLTSAIAAYAFYAANLNYFLIF